MLYTNTAGTGHARAPCPSSTHRDRTDESPTQVAEGFIEVGRYGVSIKTPKRLFQLFAESDSVCKAWRKNLVHVITQGRGGQ